MLEMRARLICDRCHKEICEMDNIEDELEARGRLVDGPPSGYCESEDGDDVCGACWETWERQRLTEPPLPGDAVARGPRASTD